MRPFRQTRWLWLLPVLILLWIAGAASEVRESLLLEKKGEPIIGRLESAEWVVQKGGRTQVLAASWTHEGRTYRNSFRLPTTTQMIFVDLEGRPLVEEVELRYVPSRPEIAVVAAAPRDPAWVGMIIGGLGITAFCGVIWVLVAGRRPAGKVG